MEEKPRILIVEDEQALAKALRLKLEENNYEITIAFDGKEALDTLSKHTFDLIILDILMPTMDGWDVLTKLKDTGQKILILSNLSQDEDMHRAFSLGARGFLIKANTSLTEVVEYADKLLKEH